MKWPDRLNEQCGDGDKTGACETNLTAFLFSFCYSSFLLLFSLKYVGRPDLAQRLRICVYSAFSSKTSVILGSVILLYSQVRSFASAAH